MLRGAIGAGDFPTFHRAEKCHCLLARLEPRQRLLQRGCRGLHERVMKRMVDLDQARKNSLRLQLRDHGLQRGARTGQRERAGAIERGDLDRAIVL